MIDEAPRTVRAFMCKVDWDHELGEASGGTKLYSSLRDLKAQRRCVAECGAVEVEVRYVATRVPEAEVE